jgi:CheY-like chemotaxis protein
MEYAETILLVEDNRMDIELALDAFREAEVKHLVRVLRNGQTALDYMLGAGEYADRSKHPLPALILLDLKLPGIDGLQVARTLKTTPLVRRIPVVVLTSSKRQDDRTAAYDFGINSYVIKPISFDGFVGLIRQLTGYWLQLNYPAMYQ